MNGLGGLNKSPNGVVIGLVQLQLPVVVSPADLSAQTTRICELVGKARRNLPGMDLVVFPEYALHGLSMDTEPGASCAASTARRCGLPRRRAATHRIWGCFSSWRRTRTATPTTAASSSTTGASCGCTTASYTPGSRSSRGNPATSASRSATDPTAAASRSSSVTTGCFPRWRASAPTRAPRS